MASRRPIVADRQLAIAAGIACYVLGAILLWDAYEHRGRSRPFWGGRVLGGLV